MSNIDSELEELLGEGAEAQVSEEIESGRKNYDLIDRLTSRPKRKPEIVTVYLDEETGQELGYARDVRNDYGVVVSRAREGVIGELDKARSEEGPDEKLIAKLEKRASELVKKLKKDSLTFTLQWIPPIAQEVIEKEAAKAVGEKGVPVPEKKIKDWQAEYFARLLSSTLVSMVDNSDGTKVTKLNVAACSQFKKLLPPDQFDRLDTALGKLQYRSAIVNESVDSADF